MDDQEQRPWWMPDPAQAAQMAVQRWNELPEERKREIEAFYRLVTHNPPAFSQPTQLQQALADLREVTQQEE